ncbi:MAG: SpoVG family protein [Alphaproteobacteria bacterium]|nr:SpoVG family protein [Alphaproteobacteria bacterium]
MSATVTQIVIDRTDKKDGVLATCSVTINDSFCISGIKIKKHPECGIPGYFLIDMPKGFSWIDMNDELEVDAAIQQILNQPQYKIEQKESNMRAALEVYYRSGFEFDASQLGRSLTETK